MSTAASLEEFCPECGEWVSYLSYDQATGWCYACLGDEATARSQLQCRRCGSELPPGAGRTTCTNCRQETWFRKYVDELEYLVVAKHYSPAQARLTIIKMVRPICRNCKKPIKGAHDHALFHKGKDYAACHRQYMKFARLRRKGLSREEALKEIGLL